LTILGLGMDDYRNRKAAQHIHPSECSSSSSSSYQQSGNQKLALLKYSIYILITSQTMNGMESHKVQGMALLH